MTKKGHQRKTDRQKRESFAFRPPSFLKQRIIESAAASDHSLSAEVMFRLMQAYCDSESALAKLMPPSRPFTDAEKASAAGMLLNDFKTQKR